MIQPPSLAGICANYNLLAPDFAIEHVYHSSKMLRLKVFFLHSLEIKFMALVLHLKQFLKVQKLFSLIALERC